MITTGQSHTAAGRVTPTIRGGLTALALGGLLAAGPLTGTATAAPAPATSAPATAQGQTSPVPTWLPLPNPCAGLWDALRRAEHDRDVAARDDQAAHRAHDATLAKVRHDATHFTTLQVLNTDLRQNTKAQQAQNAANQRLRDAERAFHDAWWRLQHAGPCQVIRPLGGFPAHP